MCMQRESFIQTAAKDIVCWKVVRLMPSEQFPGKFIIKARHRDDIVKGGKRRAKQFPQKEGYPSDRFPGCRIHGKSGGFYAYLQEKEAQKRKWNNTYLVLKCLVPKGVRFISGLQTGRPALRAEYMIQGVA